PLAATDVNHGVPAGDPLPALSDCQVTLTGERPVCKQHRPLSCQQQHAAVYFSQHVSLVKHTQHIM
ncbi:unnamed protein product, partial [Staurois parvus]